MAVPRISIIIPTKNEENYIERTLAQFEPLFERYQLEIVVSDANSTDKTLEIVRLKAAEFPGRIQIATGIGPQTIAIGRNAGAAMAKGDILFHTDADVQIPNLEQFFDCVLYQFATRNIVAAAGPLWVYPAESKMQDKLYHILMNGIIRLSYTVGVYLAKGECQIVRRANFEQIHGYNESLVAGEDCNLFYRLSKIGRIGFFNQIKVYHSPRRFRKYGYFFVTWVYLREGIWLLFRGKSFSAEWKPVR